MPRPGRPSQPDAEMILGTDYMQEADMGLLFSGKKDSAACLAPRGQLSVVDRKKKR